MKTMTNAVNTKQLKELRDSYVKVEKAQQGIEQELEQEFVQVLKIYGDMENVKAQRVGEDYIVTADLQFIGHQHPITVTKKLIKTDVMNFEDRYVIEGETTGGVLFTDFILKLNDLILDENAHDFPRYARGLRAYFQNNLQKVELTSISHGGVYVEVMHEDVLLKVIVPIGFEFNQDVLQELMNELEDKQEELEGMETFTHEQVEETTAQVVGYFSYNPIKEEMEKVSDTIEYTVTFKDKYGLDVEVRVVDKLLQVEVDGHKLMEIITGDYRTEVNNVINALV